jgi:hypothetical protein
MKNRCKGKILDILMEDRIFSIHKSKNGVFCFLQGNDPEYGDKFQVDLGFEQMNDLIKELQLLVE